MISILSLSRYLYKIYKLFLRSTIWEYFRGSCQENLHNLRRLIKSHKTLRGYNGKNKLCFLFDHKGLVVISLAFWIIFAYDSSLRYF